MEESHFARVTREGIEKRITEAYEAGDMHLVNEQLDIYPTGRPRVVRKFQEMGALVPLVKRDNPEDLIA